MSDNINMFFKVLAVMAVGVVGTALAEGFDITRSTINDAGRDAKHQW